MKQILCAVLLLCSFSLLNGQSNDITNKLGISGDYKVLKSDDTELLKVAGASGLISGTKVAFTPEGGIAVKLINKTGSASVKGTVVTPYGSSADGAVTLTPTGAGVDRPVGVMYENGIADGSECWVVVSGVADVLATNTGPVTGATVRGYVALTSTGTAGRVDVTNDPNSSVHDRECGHFLEAVTLPAMVKVMLHFR